jgi:hypothetical protein
MLLAYKLANQVLLGVHILEQAKYRGIILQVIETKKHPQYVAKHYYFDVAVLKAWLFRVYG